MAAGTSVSVDEEHFSCPVCLEILRDPVTIPCGHSYCRGCIKGYWRKTQRRSGYSCPQCRRSFDPRPVLARNTVLAGVVDRLEEAGLRDAAHAGPGDAGCDVCPGGRSRAVKSCVKCRASYCELHLKQHNERDRNKTHQVTEVTGQLQKRVCAQHSRLLELYCRTDRQLVCPLCVTDGHCGHHTVPAAEERTETQRLLEEAFRRSKQKSKEKEKDLMAFLKYLKRSAQAVESDSEKICTKLLRSVERRHAEVKEQVRAKERAALSQVEEALELLEQQAEGHRRRRAELERLSQTDDHVHFLLRCRTLVPADPVEPGMDVHPYFSLMILKRAVTELQERLNDVCERELARIAGLVKDESGLSGETSPPETGSPVKSADPGRIEPKLRAEFLHYCCDVVLDPNTVNPYLCLSEGNRKVSACPDPQRYPEHPDRFSSWTQLLGRDGLSSRSYWEVEWSGHGGIAVGVAYRTVNRHGGSADGKLGCNAKSWCLDISDGHCTYQHNKTRLETPTPLSPRIGVYLDHRAGLLAFYCISPRRDNMTLLHRAQTTFLQPLYPAFWLGLESTIKVCSVFGVPKTGTVHSL